MFGRPNTQIADDQLSRNLIVAPGEDSEELLQAAERFIGYRVPTTKRYRCFEFWNFKKEEITLALTGPGTAGQDPLLNELLGSPRIQNVVMVGTCGVWGEKPLKLGEPYLVEKAYVAHGACGLDLPRESLPLRPRLDKLQEKFLDLPRASLVSSEYYYSFSQNKDADTRLIQKGNPRVAEAARHYHGMADLVDMETAAFYYFCGAWAARRRDLTYVAIRGAANPVSDFSQQREHSLSVMAKCMGKAVDFCRYTTQTFER